MSKDKDAGQRGPRAGTSRLKELRRELVDLESDLERARRRRDKAQARLEALEAIAEQLASSITAAAVADEARLARRDAADAAAVAAGQSSSEAVPKSAAKPKAPAVPKAAAKPKAPAVPKAAATVPQA